MIGFLWGLCVAWICCIWYYASQGADEDDTKGALIIEAMLILVAVILTMTIATGTHLVTNMDSTPTPTIGGR